MRADVLTGLITVVTCSAGLWFEQAGAHSPASAGERHARPPIRRGQGARPDPIVVSPLVHPALPPDIALAQVQACAGDATESDQRLEVSLGISGSGRVGRVVLTPSSRSAFTPTTLSCIEHHLHSVRVNRVEGARAVVLHGTYRLVRDHGKVVIVGRSHEVEP